MLKKLRNARCLFICIVLCAMSFGCDTLYRMLDKEGAEEKELIGEIVPFESNLIVEEVQNLLYLYGYNTGKVDGVLGLRTRNAIEKFQKDNGLEPSRFIDHKTWERLHIFSNNGLVIKGQLNIKMVQALLKEAGFDPGSIDGKIGPRTESAVLKFQEAQGLKVDGKIGFQTLSKLAAFIPAESQME